ncbi:MAG: HAD-IIIA family hydrolase [Deltaproteobacteria bacterium]|nr:HAD-IIIA family hydrolase [Deltaproteobacteria bacterium]MBI2181081.1 HAD-IIIA family hydrolase [Deltaproteobacteria bacterium]
MRKKVQEIKLLLLDVDGVLTDGGIYIDDRGVESKRFDVRDGQGITLLKRAGIKVGVISGRSSGAVRRRAAELGVKLLYQGVRDKSETYERIKTRTGLKDEQIAYMGDDIMDIPILRAVGWAITVPNGWPGVRPVVDYVTEAKGGRGAVREISELIISTQNQRKLRSPNNNNGSI